MLVTIVFAVLILLVLIIGFFFLSSSDIFLVFSIVAFMVLVVLSVDFVVSRRKRIAKKERKKRERRRQEQERQEKERQEEQRQEQERSEEQRKEEQRPEEQKPEKSTIWITSNDLVTIITGEDVISYEKKFLDVDDIFVDETWENEMIRSMLYDKIAISFADLEEIKTLFWRPYNFELVISNRVKTISRADAIYSFVQEAKKLIKDLGIYKHQISRASMYSILKKGSFIADEDDFKQEMNKVTEQEKEEFKQYRKAKKGDRSQTLKEFVDKAKNDYKRFLENNWLIKTFQRMVEVETKNSIEKYPLTWFYRTPHEKLVTIFMKSWSKREKYKQAYVVLYFSISKFVNKVVIDDNRRRRNKLKLKDLKNSEINLIPPLSVSPEEKKQFIHSIREANEQRINREIGLLIERLEDIKMYYEFYKSLNDDSLANFPELLRLYVDIASYVYQNRKEFLFYNIIDRNGPEVDIIYAPLFIYVSFPDLINVAKNMTINNNKSLLLRLDHQDFRQKIGEIIKQQITDDVIEHRFTPVIMCCFFFNFSFEQFENFVKALFVILFYISMTSLETFLDTFVFMKSLFYERESFMYKFNNDYRFRGSMVFGLYQSLFSYSQSFKDSLERIRRNSVFRQQKIDSLIGEAKDIKKEIDQIPDEKEREEKQKKLEKKKQEIAINQDLLVKEQKSSKTLINQVETLFPIQKESLQNIEVPDFRRKLKDYEFNFEDNDFIFSCYRYIIGVLISSYNYRFTDMPFKDEMRKKYQISSLNGM